MVLPNSVQIYSSPIMANVTPEIKPARLRNDWSQVLSFVLVYVPLVAGAAIWSIFGFGVAAITVLWACLMFTTVAIVAMAVAAFVNARRIARQLESVSDVVRQL